MEHPLRPYDYYINRFGQIGCTPRSAAECLADEIFWQKQTPEQRFEEAEKIKHFYHVAVCGHPVDSLTFDRKAITIHHRSC